MKIILKILITTILIGYLVAISTAAGPYNPHHEGSIVNGAGGPFLDGACSVFVAGNYAYVASKDSDALEIVDVSNPAYPHHEGSILTGAGGVALLDGPCSVYVSGNYAYVVSVYSNALEIVDISYPHAPHHEGSIVNGAGGALLNYPVDVYVVGNYAYVASANSNALEIVDVSNPAAPHHEGSIVNGAGGALLNGAYSVYVVGNYAYVASAVSDALEIVDVSNPAAPHHVGSWINEASGALLDGACSVYVSGNYAYVASYDSDALEIVDVSNPAAPHHEGSIVNGAGGALLNGAYSVYVVGNYAYVASYDSDALEIVDVSNSAIPQHAGSIVNGFGTALLDGAVSVYVSGNYAYVASDVSNALEIVDIGDYSGIGVFRPSTHTFCLDYNNNGAWNGASTDRQYNFGLNGDKPVAGDWNTDYIAEIGVFRPSTHTFYLDYNGNGKWDGPVTDRQYNFGLTGDIPVSGFWGGEGEPSRIGVFRPSTHTFYLDYNGNGRWDGAVTDRQYNFGLTGDIPVSLHRSLIIGSYIGVFRPSTHTFYLDMNGNGKWEGAVTDRQLNFGLTGDLPVAGDWDSDGHGEIGVFRPSTHTFYLDYNRNGKWDGPVTDRQYNFGLASDSPISGIWN